MTSMLLAMLLSGGGRPVEVPVPQGTDLSVPHRLVRVADGAEVPFQIVPGNPPSIAWILEQEDGKAEFRLERGSPRQAPAVNLHNEEGRYLQFGVNGHDALRYNYGLMKAPEGAGEMYDRSGYIHPVWTPFGRVVTNDFPKDHYHHHGLWSAWTSSEFEGRKVDFWNAAEKVGWVEHGSLGPAYAGPVFGGFRATHRYIDRSAPGGPREALLETWDVRLYAQENPFVIDLVSTQRCSSDSPLVIREYRYGGVGFRGSGEWEGEEGVQFLTSDRKTRVDGHATPARWCAMTGKLDDVLAKVGFLCHPSNFRAPQPMRIHPTEPFFNWAPSQAGDFTIEPGKDYVSRYRFVIAEGPVDHDEMERHWRHYADPPPVTLTR